MSRRQVAVTLARRGRGGRAQGRVAVVGLPQRQVAAVAAQEEPGGAPARACATRNLLGRIPERAVRQCEALRAPRCPPAGRAGRCTYRLAGGAVSRQDSLIPSPPPAGCGSRGAAAPAERRRAPPGARRRAAAPRRRRPRRAPRTRAATTPQRAGSAGVPELAAERQRLLEREPRARVPPRPPVGVRSSATRRRPARRPCGSCGSVTGGRGAGSSGLPGLPPRVSKPGPPCDPPGTPWDPEPRCVTLNRTFTTRGTPTRTRRPETSSLSMHDAKPYAKPFNVNF